MSARRTKINLNSNKNNKNLNQNLEALEKIVFINVKSNLEENVVSVKLNQNNKARKHWNILKFSSLLQRTFNKSTKYETQKESFKAAMKCLIVVGQIIGVFPLFCFKGKNVPKQRWAIFLWRYVFSIFMSISQLMAALLCFRSLVTNTVTITNFSYFSFYLSTFVSSLAFMRLSTKWNYLMRQLETAELNEYIDPCIEYKCNFAVIVMIGLAIVEHSMSIAVKFAVAQECGINSTSTLHTYMKYNYFWIYTFDVPYSKGFAVYLVVKNYLITLIWTYLHLFVICISMYLTSILEQINKVILSREGQYLPSSYWRKLRIDYNRVSRLVRCFDDSINSIVLMSFACSMFFSCLKLYYFISDGFYVQRCYNYPNYDEKNSNNSTGYLHCYLAIVFATCSLVFVLLRFLAAALIVAKVHSASLVVAPVLYSVPSPTFCTEIQRFIEQIHGNTVALTGLNFFYVNKELILNIVGTIVTYELVLLQFVKS